MCTSKHMLPKYWLLLAATAGLSSAAAAARAQQPVDLYPLDASDLPSPTSTEDEVADAPEEMELDASEGDSEDEAVDEPHRPTWGDYAAQQQTNAELAARIAELTHATHLLWQEEYALRRKGHHLVQRAHQVCENEHGSLHETAALKEEESKGPLPEDISAATAALKKHVRGHGSHRGHGHRHGHAHGHHQLQQLPWSLTHTAAKHRRTHGSHQAAGEVGADTPSLANLAGLYPDDDSEQKPVAGPETPATEKTRLEDELQASRAKLGKNEEARVHLEREVRALEAQFTNAEKLAQKRKSDIASAQARENAKKSQLESDEKHMKGHLSPNGDMETALRNELGATLQEVDEKIAEEKRDLLEFRNQADSKLRARKEEELAAEKQKEELQKQYDEAMAKEREIQAQLKSALGQHKNLSKQVLNLQSNTEEVEHQERTEEQRLANENEKLRDEESQERQCMEWGHKLQARLQRELQDKMNDAKLCRDGILSLHNERQELRKRSDKYKHAIEEARQQEEEAKRNADENKGLLDNCLGQLQR